MKTIIYSMDEIEQAGAVIRAGGLVAFPTETVYGLGANALDAAAARRIFAAKGRPQDNPLIAHIADLAMLDELCHDIPDTARRIAERFWPGPLTMALPKRAVVPDTVTAGLQTVGIRFPSHPVAQALIRAAGVPIAAPSANRSGKPSPTTFAHVFADMNGRIDGIIDGGNAEVGVESTFMEFVNGKVRILRPGYITPEDLAEVVGAENVEIDGAVLRGLSENEHPRSPGMKYRHYAPSAPVIAVLGANGDCAREIRRGVRGHTGAAAIVCDEYADLIPCETLRVGRYGDYAAQAHRLFDALRELDRPGVEIIYAQCPDDRGVGLAVANRLKRAAGFHVVNARHLTVLGLTGSTGAGKGVVSRVLADAGAKIIDCDAVYHEMLAHDAAMLADLQAEFPDAFAEGRLDRKALGRIVFRDSAKLERLNAVVHPHIRRRIAALLDELETQGTALAVLDAPTLFESGADQTCDFTLGVTADPDVRVARIMARDGLDADYAALRIWAGKPDGYYSAKCDFMIENNGAPEDAECAARAVLKKVILQ